MLTRVVEHEGTGGDLAATRGYRTFTQEDPIGLAGGLNLYGFANGDPVNFSDPFGLCPPEDEDPCPGAEGADAGGGTVVIALNAILGVGEAHGLSFGLAVGPDGTALFASYLGGAGVGASAGLSVTTQVGSVEDLRADNETGDYRSDEATEIDLSFGALQPTARIGPSGSARGSGFGWGVGVGAGAFVTQAKTKLRRLVRAEHRQDSFRCMRFGDCPGR